MRSDGLFWHLVLTQGSQQRPRSVKSSLKPSSVAAKAAQNLAEKRKILARVEELEAKANSENREFTAQEAAEAEELSDRLIELCDLY